MFLAEFVDDVYICFEVEYVSQMAFGLSRKLSGTTKIIFRITFYDFIVRIPKSNSQRRLHSNMITSRLRVT